MNRTLLLTILLSLIFSSARSQYQLAQYFDGDDTLVVNSIIINIDPDTNNIWQIGSPQKVIFDSANTLPNAIVTDTINLYPINNKSVFSFNANNATSLPGIVALRWTQKLDMEFQKDGGYVEYSIDSGNTWINVLTDVNAYNVYGFDTLNVDTLPDGTTAFTGKDTLWKDVWVCYLSSYFDTAKSLTFRFTFQSDSVDGLDEGWLIDNMLLQKTIFHTVGKVDPEKSFLVYPTIASDMINVSTGDNNLDIGNIILTNVQGKVVRHLKNKKQKVTIDVADLPPGTYYLSVYAGSKLEAHQIVISR